MSKTDKIMPGLFAGIHEASNACDWPRVAKLVSEAFASLPDRDRAAAEVMVSVTTMIGDAITWGSTLMQLVMSGADPKVIVDYMNTSPTNNAGPRVQAAIVAYAATIKPAKRKKKSAAKRKRSVTN